MCAPRPGGYPAWPCICSALAPCHEALPALPMTPVTPVCTGAWTPPLLGAGAGRSHCWPRPATQTKASEAGLHPNPSSGEHSSPRATQRGMGGGWYSRLWQPGMQDTFASKNSKKSAAVETCLWYYFAQGSLGCLQKEKGDLASSVKKDTPQGSVPSVYFPHTWDCSQTTHRRWHRGKEQHPGLSGGQGFLSALGLMARDGTGLFLSPAFTGD